VATPEAASNNGAMLGIALASLLAIGLGVGTGWILSQRMNRGTSSELAAAPAGDGQPGIHAVPESPPTDATRAGAAALNTAAAPVPALGPSKIIALPPIMTSIAKPQSTWLRLEAALIVAGDEHGVDDQVGELGDDMLTYLRTIELSQIEGPSGLRFLKDDLLDRAKVRTDGQVRDIVIKTLVVE